MLEIALKAAHIAFLSVWAAGLVALPSLLDTAGISGGAERGRQLRFVRLGYQRIVSPAAILTVATGIALIFVASFETPWLGIKLAAVGGMALLHMLIGAGIEHRRERAQFSAGERRLMTLGALACISIVLIFVLGKPELDPELFPVWFREGRPEGFADELFSGFTIQLTAARACLLRVFGQGDGKAVLEHELAAMPSGEGDQHQLECRKQGTPGQHGGLRISDAMLPVERQHAEQGHGDYPMAPGGGVLPGAGNGQRLAETRQGGGRAHHKGRSGPPERRAGEEGIERPPIGGIAPRHPENTCNGKGDEHGVERVAQKGDPAVEVLDAFGAERCRAIGTCTVHGHAASFFASWFRGAAILAGTAFLSGCAGPLSTLEPAGPVAGRIAALWWVMLTGAALILAGVGVLALLPFLNAGRLRRVSPALYLWGGGLVFTLTVLAALLLYTFALHPLAGTAREGPPVRVKAIGEQWQWTFVHYDAPGGALKTQGRLHIPAGRPVEVAIVSEDVIHSFWVPRLAGKRDAIPGRVNTLTLLADRPGVYGGVCNEFCGFGHAGMTFEVVAHATEEYADVLAALAAGRPLPDEDTQRRAKP